MTPQSGETAESPTPATTDDRLGEAKHRQPAAGSKRRLEAGRDPPPSANGATESALASRTRPTRKRKKTRVFEISLSAPARRIHTGALGKAGRGERLTDIPNVAYHLDKASAKDVEVEFLHRLLFNFAGAAHRRKTNIRTFSGFVFESERERERVRDKLVRANLNLVRKVARFLDVRVTRTMGGVEGEEAACGVDDMAVLDEEKRALMAEAMGMDDNEIIEACRSRSEAINTPTEPAREATMTAGKDELIGALLEFLEGPRTVEGRESLAERDKEARRQKRATEKMRAQKAALEKAAEKRAMLLRKNETRDSDEDGDEDLETGGTTWIQLAAQRKQTGRDGGAAKRDGSSTRRDGGSTRRDGGSTRREGGAAKREGGSAKREGGATKRDGRLAKRNGLVLADGHA